MTDRPQKAQDAREGELFRLLVENVKDYAIFVIDPEGRVESWNPGAERLLGFREEEMIGQSIAVFFTPEDIEKGFPQREMQQALKEGRGNDDRWHVRKDGSRFWCGGTLTPLWDEGHKLRGFAKIMRDRTEWKDAEQARRGSEARQAAILETALDAIITIDYEGRVVEFNPAAEKLFGYAAADVRGRDIGQLIVPPRLRQAHQSGLARYLSTGEGPVLGKRIEVPALRADGTEFPVELAITRIPTDGPPLFTAYLRDISERARAAEALHEAHQELENRVAERTAQLVRANEFLKALLEDVQTGVVACDAAGFLTLFNGVTRELHGLPEEAIPPEQWAGRYRLFRPDGHTPMAKEDVPLFRALEGERVQDAEMVIAPEGIQPRTVLASGRAFFDAQGKKLGAVVSMQDITARKRAEEELRKAHEELERRVVERTEQLARANEALREADRRKDEFLATLAHELRNPLAPIRNSLQILKMPRVDAATVQQTREMMERQVHHLVRLVDDLLDVSRVMRGKIELRKEPVEPATVVARAVETAQPLIEVQGHRLDISLPPESLLLDADPVRLVQVVGNLLTNSAKYTEANGHIWLTAEREGDQAVLRVRDDGIGIAPDMLPHVFELFVQVDHASTKAHGGLGIGLTLVKNLVEMHGGTVEAHSAGLGKGCEFIVRLPLMVQERQPKEKDNGEPQQESARSSGHRLLVVDDNQDAAISLAMLLRLQGHEVRVAHSGPAALEMTKTYVPHAVFLDIGMPGMDGYEVARRLRQQPGTEKVALAALTGWGQQEDRRRTAEAGFDHHLVKPPEPKAIESVLAELPTPHSQGKEAN